jgi:hydrogenase maturation factor HypF (carbamoyltransferase family)
MPDPDYFQIMEHTLQCRRSECGEKFNEPLARLVYPNEFPCRKCGEPIDLREAKLHGELGKDFDTATQLNKQAMQKK